MGGEGAKKSGEIGEEIASTLLEKIGWKRSIHNISIDCNTPAHLTDSGNQRSTHGEDQIFLYHSPFHDDRTDFVHVSVKNTINKYPTGNTLKTKFKADLKELHETIECAKYSPKLQSISSFFGAKKYRCHSGLLIFLQNDHEGIEKNIKEELANTRLEITSDEPVYFIDNARASFLLKIVDDLIKRSMGGGFEFFYPRIGTAASVDIKRTGSFLPLELIASDIVPAIVRNGKNQEIILYANETYDPEVYKKLIAYALNFATGLVTIIKIGMPDYNPAKDENEANEVRMVFHERSEIITPFCFNRSILDLLQEE